MKKNYTSFNPQQPVRVGEHFWPESGNESCLFFFFLIFLLLCLGFLGEAALGHLAPPCRHVGGSRGSRQEGTSPKRQSRVTWLLAMHRSRSSCLDGPRSLTGVSIASTPWNETLRVGGFGGLTGSRAGSRFRGCIKQLLWLFPSPPPLQNRSLLSVGMGSFWMHEVRVMRSS